MSKRKAVVEVPKELLESFLNLSENVKLSTIKLMSSIMLKGMYFTQPYLFLRALSKNFYLV